MHKNENRASFCLAGTETNFKLGIELSKREKRAIRTSIIKGCKYMNDIYREESAIWYPLEEEVRLKYEAEIEAAGEK